MPRLILLTLSAFLLVAGACPAGAQAQDQAGYTAAAFLLQQTTQPYRDGSHNAMLRSLRQLRDQDLLPFYNALSQSRFPPQRVHGVLAGAELSPDRRLDLALLAEIEDQRELIEILSAAMDDKLIDKAGLTTLLQWDKLPLAVKQAIALRLVSMGGLVDSGPYRKSLDVSVNADTGTGDLLQYALAALLLAETGDAAGTAALDALVKLENVSTDAVFAQVFDGAMQHKLKSAGPLALSIAKDAKRTATLRMLAIQCALRLQAKGAMQAWQVLYANESEPARRIRLALIALDSADQADATLFDMLTASDDPLLSGIGKSGRVIATKQGDLANAFAPLIALGHPTTTGWIVAYCERDKPAGYQDVLQSIILQHNVGQARNRARLADAAIRAVQVLCDLDPEQANTRLAKLLGETTKANDADNVLLAKRQILLVGIARSNSANLQPLAKSIEPDEHNDFTTDALRLLIRARHGASLTQEEWARVSDMIQGVGQTDMGLRVQLAWLYLEHLNKGEQAIKDAIR